MAEPEIATRLRKLAAVARSNSGTPELMAQIADALGEAAFALSDEPTITVNQAQLTKGLHAVAGNGVRSTDGVMRTVGDRHFREQIGEALFAKLREAK